jgi:hypothetical protein
MSETRGNSSLPQLKHLHARLQSARQFKARRYSPGLHYQLYHDGRAQSAGVALLVRVQFQLDGAEHEVRRSGASDSTVLSERCLYY